MKAAILATTLLLSACAQSGGVTATQSMPEDFDYPRFSFHSDKKPDVIRRRMAGSKCGTEGDSMSTLALMSGLNARSSGSGVQVATGVHTDGSRWIALTSTAEPDFPLCGVRLVPQGEGTEVRVVGLRRTDVALVTRAVEDGTLFCQCEALSR